MHVGPALLYLKDVGHEMSEHTYFRKKKELEDMKLERLEFIAKHFEDQHLHRLDKLELIENLMWENYHAEKNPSKKVKILESIVNTQPYLSSYYEVTKTVYEHSQSNGHSDGDTILSKAEEEPIVGFESEP